MNKNVKVEKKKVNNFKKRVKMISRLIGETIKESVTDEYVIIVGVGVGLTYALRDEETPVKTGVQAGLTTAVMMTSVEVFFRLHEQADEIKNA